MTISRKKASKKRDSRNQIFNLIFLILCSLSWLSLAGATSSTDSPKGPIIGIDLGTTYSVCGVYKNGALEIVANDQGNRITPSYVAFTDNARLVGDSAKNQATINPENTIFDVKRLIGRKYSDPSVQSDKKLVPYEIIPDKNDKPMIQVKQANKTLKKYQR